MLLFPATAVAQVSNAPSLATPVVPIAAPQTWASLGKQEKLALAPLELSWHSLSEGQKRKWVAIAKTYPALGAPEQAKLHSRMAQWATLPPKERELARLNFAQSKAVTQSERAANWEAYQALSPEERTKLAAGVKAKPTGAAVAVKPVAPDKLTAVPVTRNTPAQERAAAPVTHTLNRKTLLPLPASAASREAAQPNTLPQ